MVTATTAKRVSVGDQIVDDDRYFAAQLPHHRVPADYTGTAVFFRKGAYEHTAELLLQRLAQRFGALDTAHAGGRHHQLFITGAPARAPPEYSDRRRCRGHRGNCPRR